MKSGLKVVSELKNSASKALAREFRRNFRFAPGPYTIGHLTGKTEGFGRYIEWYNDGNANAGQPTNGGSTQKIKAHIIPRNYPSSGMSGSFDVEAELQDTGDKTNITSVQMVKGKANILGFRFDLAGKKLSNVEIPIEVKPIEGKPVRYTVTGKFDPLIIKELPTPIKTFLSLLSTKVRMSASFEAEGPTTLPEKTIKVAPKR